MKTRSKLSEKGTIREDIEFCQKCGNGYVVLWIIESKKYKDFGLRHCPFCGLIIDEERSVPP